MNSARATRALLLAVCAYGLLVQPARAGSDDDRYNIMRPEPWLAPKYKSPRASKQRVAPPRTQPALEPRIAEPPPPIVLPETGRVLPNLPMLPQGSVPGGRPETFGDRSLRCSHQAGLYGVPGDQRGSYIGACVNQ